jgi:hypothetical protein
LEEYNQAARQPVERNGEDPYSTWSWEDVGWNAEMSSYNERIRRRAENDNGDEEGLRLVRRTRMRVNPEPLRTQRTMRTEDYDPIATYDQAFGNTPVYSSVPTIRDTRRDGVVFEDYPSGLPSSSILGGVIPVDLPYRRHFPPPPPMVIDENLVQDPISEPQSDIPDAVWDAGGWSQRTPYVDFSLNERGGDGSIEGYEGMPLYREDDHII